MTKRILFIIPFLFASLAVQAQTSRGTVSGLVSDATSAAIPAARVDLKSAQTGLTRSTVSNEAGYYRFDAVDLGSYQIAVSGTGFQNLLTQTFEVTANQVRTLDVRLEIGEQKSVLQVTAEGVSLQSDSPLRGANIEAAAITQLPFASRNPVSLAFTIPGVTTNRAGAGIQTFSVNGGRGRSNNFLIDGTENNDISVAGQGFQITNPDVIQEVSVQTSNYDSEFGRAGGAVVNVITKGGSNSFHGTASLLLDVTNDDATTLNQSIDPVVIARGKPLPGTDQWWSGTIGGPIRRNKLFFFQGFQEERQRSSGSSDVIAPTAAGRATLNQLFPRGRNPRVDLLNAVTGSINGTANLFSIPLSEGRPDVQFGTAVFGYPQTQRDRQTTSRLDYALSDRTQISGRFLFDDTNIPVAALNFPDFITGQHNRYQNAQIAVTRVLSPTKTNELRLAYNRITLFFPSTTENPLGQTLPLYDIAQLGASTIGRSIGGYFGVQTNLPQGRIANNYLLQDTFTWTHGAHNVRFGAELTRQKSRQFAPIIERGLLVYRASTGYSGLANFVDDFGGSAGNVRRDFGNPAYYPNLFRQGYFLQDRWRVKPSLTLSLGLRYEYFGLPMNTLRTPGYEGIFNIDPVSFTGPFSRPNKVEPDKNNFAPSIGIAWSPSATSGFTGSILGQNKTVIRMGYQIGYDSFFNNIASNAATSTPNVVATQIDSTVSSALPRGLANLSSLLPVTPRPFNPLDAQSLVDKHLVNPYFQRYSFGIQREFFGGTILDLSYVGSKGTKLFAQDQFNPIVPSSLRIAPSNIASIPSARIGNRYDVLSGSRATRTNNGSSIYNAFQLNLAKRARNGMFGNFAYTFSKLLDYGSDVFAASNAPGNTAVPSIFGGMRRDRGYSLFYRPNRAVVSAGYDLPWRKNKRDALALVAGGWTVSGVYTYETGVPVNILNGVDGDGLDGSNDRPNFNPSGQAGVRAVPNPASPTGYINPDAPGRPSIDPARAQYIGIVANTGTTVAPTGNLGRNTFRNGATNNWNVNFFKRVAVTERFQLEFRSEMFNLWNKPQRGLGSVSPFSPANSTPSASVTNSPDGQFLNLGVLDGGGRVIRYQLKFLF